MNSTPEEVVHSAPGRPGFPEAASVVGEAKMIAWLIKYWKDSDGGTPNPPDDDIDCWIEERRRLTETLTCYRDFGFDEMAAGCKRRIRLLTDRIRASRRGTSGRPV